MDNFLIEDDDIKIKKFEKSYFKYSKIFPLMMIYY